MEKAVAAFSDVGRELAIVKMDHSVRVCLVCNGRFALECQGFSPAGHSLRGHREGIWCSRAVFPSSTYYWDVARVRPNHFSVSGISFSASKTGTRPSASSAKCSKVEVRNINEELAVITSKFRKKKGSCSLGPNVINK